MLERLKAYTSAAIERLKGLSPRARLFGGLALAAVVAAGLAAVLYARHVDYERVYTNLTEREIGEIAARLDAEGIPYRISPDGRSLDVDRRRAAEVRVKLAAEGLPRTGTITYDALAKNTGMGLTDRQFSTLERKALENELARMIETGIRGVERAQVMLTLPEPSIWVAQTPGEASAAVILHLAPGVRLEPPAVAALYTLVEKSVPNLKRDNIAITDQYGTLLEPPPAGEAADGPDYARMQEVKRAIERDVEGGLARLLTPIFGPGKFVVQAFATVDFTARQSEEHLVTAPDEANRQGLVLSMEKLSETWQGEGQPPGGIAGVGTTDVPGYQATGTGRGQYERTEDRVNYELNRITRTVKEQPYALKDLAVNIALDAGALGLDPNDPRVADLSGRVRDIAANVVRSALADAGANAGDPAGRVQVVVEKFSTGAEAGGPPAAPWWQDWRGLAAAGVLLALIALLAFLLIRRRKAPAEADAPGFSAVLPPEAEAVPPLQLEETDEARIQKQLERLAREKPKDFVAVLRTWLKEDG
ncbi:MAG: flagellar M-ring protein FliF [Hydrogenibacillus schlegelii]|nr:flagellar M-ring protein FliF [Hydrogenibacillus schlegelii]